MVINHNVNAMNALRYMSINASKMTKAAEKLSSGLAINRASDDPSGLAVSQKMKARIIGLEQASRNTQDAVSAIQVADGALEVTTSILQRMKQLATEAANGTLKDQDRKNIQYEINQLTSEINDISSNTEFNTIKLLDSNCKNHNRINTQLMIQAGADSGQFQEIQLKDIKAKTLNISGESGGSVTSKDGKVTAKFVTANQNDKDNVVTDGNNKAVEYALDVSDPKNASAAIKIYDDAIGNVSCFRVGLGALQNVLEYRIDSLDNTVCDITAAESEIEDADMAREIMNYSRYNILSQASQAMFVQANHDSSERISQLLKSM